MPMTETRICDSTRSPAGAPRPAPLVPLGLLARVARLRQALPRQALPRQALGPGATGTC